MDLNKNLIFLVLICTSLSFVIAHPSDIRTSEESDKDLGPSWLNDLESQIFSDPEELSLFLSPSPRKSEQPAPAKKVIGQADYDTADLIEEPVIVTERPYLLGPNHETLNDEEVTMSSVETADVKDNESLESTTNADSSDNSDSSITTVSPISDEVTEASTPKDKTTFPSFDDDYLPITTSKNKSNEDTSLLSWRHNETATSNSYHILDKIILEIQPIPKSTNLDTLSRLSSKQGSNNTMQRSEVKSFAVLIVNQTWFIILGCTLVVLFCGALLFVIVRLRSKSNERSAVTLISHNDYDNNIISSVQNN